MCVCIYKVSNRTYQPITSFDEVTNVFHTTNEKYNITGTLKTMVCVT